MQDLALHTAETPPLRDTPLSGPTGSTRTLLLADDRRVGVRPRLVELADLVPSHNAETFAPHPDYPEGVQDRRYHANAAAREHVDRIARELQPEIVLLIGLRGLDGPPIYRPDGLVVGGNGRTMALQRARSRYPDAWARYQDALPEWSMEAGIDALDVLATGPNADRTRVLALELREPARTYYGRPALADLCSALNEVPTKDRDPWSEAAARARRVEAAPDILEWFQRTFPRDRTLRSWIRTSRGRTFMEKLVHAGVFSQAEAGAYRDDFGGLTDEGVQAVERMLYATAVPDADVLDAATPRSLQKLEHGIPAVVKASRMPEWDIREAVGEALEILSGVRNSAAGCVADFLAQRDAFGRSYGDRGVQLAELLEEGGKHDVKARLRKYGRLALEAQGRSEHMELFQWEPPSAAEAFQALLSPDGDGRIPHREHRAPPPEVLEEADAELTKLVGTWLREKERLARDLETKDMDDGTRHARRIWISRRRNRARDRARELALTEEAFTAIVDAVRQRREREAA